MKWMYCMCDLSMQTSRNGKISWSHTNINTLCYIPGTSGLIPGITQYAAARIIDPRSAFALLLTEEILLQVVTMTNLHGRCSTTDWQDTDIEELQAFVGLLILAGVYLSKNKSTVSLWSEKSGRSIFRATMSHKRFHQLSRTLRFDDRLSRPRHRHDKLAPVAVQPRQRHLRRRAACPIQRRV